MTNSFKTYLVSSLPLIFLFFNSKFNENIVNSFSYLIINTGYILLLYLFIILILPLMNWTKGLIDRRSLGIATFSYAAVHFLLYLLDNNISVKAITEDLIHREYIQVGYIALILFFPLVITSNQASQNILKRNWIYLHKFIYAIVFTSLLHYYLIIKADYLFFSVFVFSFLSVILLKYILSLKNE